MKFLNDEGKNSISTKKCHISTTMFLKAQLDRFLSMYTLNINQSNVSTKLKKHDFVIPEIEVTSQLIDLRSSATLC